VKQRASYLVVPTSRAVLLGARAILADHPKLSMAGTGRGRADPFVIAEAQARGCPVVTEEQGGKKEKPRIPWVCGQFGVRCCEVLDLIRAEGWTFR